MMEQQQSFSHGLLYSVAPENFSELHLHEKGALDEFDWEAYESQFEDDSFVQIVFGFLKITAEKWGIAKF